MPDVLPGVLGRFGWNDRVLALFNSLEVTGAVPARIVRVERSACVAVLPDGDEQLLHAPALPAVGDWVAAAGTAVAAVVPRWSALTRTDPSGRGVQLLAANVDIVAITAPADRLSPARVERELAAAWDSGGRPLVVLTKADLAEAGVADALPERLVGADVLATSASSGAGMEDVRRQLQPCQTAVFLGPSGAGKSTLANALLGADVLATGAVRDADRRGRHTTTSRQLVAVPGGGVLIDTPGLRSLALAGDVEVGQAIPDIEALAAACRFGDCRHSAEPGCAVTGAAADGLLDPGRLASYRKLQREMAAEARRADPVLRKAELSEWKAVMKSVRQNDKRRPR